MIKKMAINRILNKQGQALFEFIIFLPFYFLLFAVIVTLSASINGSINQQKVTRSYFHFLTKNNSMIPNKESLAELNVRGINTVGYFAIGWQDYPEGTVPIATCYKISQLATGTLNETCEDVSGLTEDEKKTGFVRPYTVFGICGGVFSFRDDMSVFALQIPSGAGSGTCALSE